jgi:hypothetical protein
LRGRGKSPQVGLVGPHRRRGDTHSLACAEEAADGHGEVHLKEDKERNHG